MPEELENLMRTKFDIGQHVKLSSNHKRNPLWVDASGYIGMIVIDEKGTHYSVDFSESPKITHSMAIQMMDEESLEAI